MTIDLARMATAQLDQLIAEAMDERAQRDEGWPEQPGDGEGIRNPEWHVSPVREGAIFSVLHYGCGWIRLLVGRDDLTVLLGSLAEALDPGTHGSAHAVPMQRHRRDRKPH